MSCTKKGQDMSIETFRNALKFDESITIGGGEPTIHPLFWQFIGEALGCTEYIWLATNGSQTNTTIALAKMAEKGILGVALSLDPFHDPIEQEVINAFKNLSTAYNRRMENTKDYREIRDTSDNLIKAGRCKSGKVGCICEDIFVKPSGQVHGCGCKNSIVLGNVNTGFEIPSEWEHGECYKKQPDLKDIKEVA